MKTSVNLPAWQSGVRRKVEQARGRNIQNDAIGYVVDRADAKPGDGHAKLQLRLAALQRSANSKLLVFVRRQDVHLS